MIASTHTNLSPNRLQPACLGAPLPITINFPRVFLKCKYFYSCLRTVLILYLNPLKLTTQPHPKGFFFSLFFFHKHRCCPSVSLPAWWPFSRVAACWLGLLTYVGVVRDHTCHSLTHHPLIFQPSRGPVLIFKSPDCFYTTPISSHFILESTHVDLYNRVVLSNYSIVAALTKSFKKRQINPSIVFRFYLWEQFQLLAAISYFACNSNQSPRSDLQQKQGGCSSTANRSAIPKKKGSPCLTSLFLPNIYTVILPYLLRLMRVRKQPISPEGCRQSSGSRCQTSYRSDRSTGSLVQDLPYRGKPNTAENVFSVALLPFFGQFSLGKLLENIDSN